MNSHRRRVWNIVWRICAAAFLCAAAGAAAQAVGTQADAAGRTTYQDAPGPAPAPRAVTVPVGNVANALGGSSVVSPRHAATVDANESARRLGQARREREQVQPDGASAADERYRRRQEKLRRGVEKVQRRLNELRQSRR